MDTEYHGKEKKTQKITKKKKKKSDWENEPKLKVSYRLQKLW